MTKITKNRHISDVTDMSCKVILIKIFRRGDIILFTENACDIVYLEEMYSRKIRELYEQQIKTVDDLNKSILFYGSKTPVRDNHLY